MLIQSAPGYGDAPIPQQQPSADNDVYGDDPQQMYAAYDDPIDGSAGVADLSLALQAGPNYYYTQDPGVGVGIGVGYADDDGDDGGGMVQGQHRQGQHTAGRSDMW